MLETLVAGASRRSPPALRVGAGHSKTRFEAAFRFQAHSESCCPVSHGCGKKSLCMPVSDLPFL